MGVNIEKEYNQKSKKIIARKSCAQSRENTWKRASKGREDVMGLMTVTWFVKLKEEADGEVAGFMAETGDTEYEVEMRHFVELYSCQEDKYSALVLRQEGMDMRLGCRIGGASVRSLNDVLIDKYFISCSCVR